MAPPYSATSADAKTPALAGNNDNGNAIIGTSKAGIGVWGGSTTSVGVGGMTDSAYGVHGVSKTGHGVHGDSASGYGVVGTTTDVGLAAVWGQNRSGKGGVGVQGDADQGTGVLGTSASYRGVSGSSQTNAGVYGESQHFDGVFGVTHNLNAAAVSGHNPAGMAGYFEGNVVVTGDITLTGADFAEQFELTNGAEPEPGTVMVTDEEGRLTPSTTPYDRRVVGVVSGAGHYKPAIVLDGQAAGQRAVIGLIGKVYCKVDASAAPILAGDLLTTSAYPGHAMKATEFDRSFGAVIGKALRPVESGRTIIPVLVSPR